MGICIKKDSSIMLIIIFDMEAFLCRRIFHGCGVTVKLMIVLFMYSGLSALNTLSQTHMVSFSWSQARICSGLTRPLVRTMETWLSASSAMATFLLTSCGPAPAWPASPLIMTTSERSGLNKPDWNCSQSGEWPHNKSSE